MNTNSALLVEINGNDFGDKTVAMDWHRLYLLFIVIDSVSINGKY